MDNYRVASMSDDLDFNVAEFSKAVEDAKDALTSARTRLYIAEVNSLFSELYALPLAECPVPSDSFVLGRPSELVARYRELMSELLARLNERFC